ncbi:MAG: 16S rRNA (cytosine(1402)-N(4))-methyltransferase RsmH [Candidatus Buchananbacteria bacterium]|nr:16S rRNA (cytosine(1402)-N(4))-methyltransferase RsmH [Candidatus Buchananbacteria bacterium]
MKNSHQPVMLGEILEYLQPSINQDFVDCTLGGGGHTVEILKRTGPDGRVIGIDLDPLAIKLTKQAADDFGERLILVQDNFKNLELILEKYQIGSVDGILLDLGLSSNQLADKERGFSFTDQDFLSMSFANSSEVTASEIVNTYSVGELENIFKQYGEENLARPIAQKIVEVRTADPITHPKILADIVSQVYQRYYRQHSKINPATKVFQALRIAVNDELENLKSVLPQAIEALKSGGRLAVISYHSLEDRIVKNFFRLENQDCICLPTMPVCQCTHVKKINLVTKKPIGPTESEVQKNPRARSAKLRVIEKI